ncbi:MAG: hypothetical protein IJ186_00815 [Bacilli bacterium]|nr:hypothetical protein [Bacilli bacterium]
MINIYSINIKEVEKYYQKELFGATTVDNFSVSEEANKEEIKEFAKSLLIKKFVSERTDNNIYFSTSFSGHYYLIAIYNKQIGIDIQRFVDIDVRLINYAFDKNERGNSITEADFARVSALKKSLMKCAKVNQEIKLNDLSSNECDGPYIFDNENYVSLAKIYKEHYYIAITYKGNFIDNIEINEINMEEIIGD